MGIAHTDETNQGVTNMKHLIAMTIAMSGCFAAAADSYVSNGKVITKIEAMKSLILSDNKNKVERCYGVEVNAKGNLTKVKTK